jgi:hypothetical protein
MYASVRSSRSLRIALLVPFLLMALLAALAATTTMTADASGVHDCSDPKGKLEGNKRWITGSISADGTSATFENWSTNCTIDVGIASYLVFDLTSDGYPRLSTQELYDANTATLGPKQKLTLTVNLPNCMAQVDAFYGHVIPHLGYERYGTRLLGAKYVGEGMCQRDGSCTLTPGYWKTHPEAWPVQQLTIGNNLYSASQLMDMLWQPTAGNGITNLTRQLIAAKLNIAMGTDPSAVSSAITQADAMIGNLVPPPIGSGYLKPSQTSSLVSTLDAYNNGKIGPGHCDKQ